MPFHALELALFAQRAVVPLVRRVQKHDRRLAQQLRDATNTFLLNLGEGAHSDPGTRRARHQGFAGSVVDGPEIAAQHLPRHVNARSRSAPN